MGLDSQENEIMRKMFTTPLKSRIYVFHVLKKILIKMVG